MMDIINWFVTNWADVMTGLVAVLSGLIAIALIIPGEQPEKTMQSILNFLKKFSIK